MGSWRRGGQRVSKLRKVEWSIFLRRERGSRVGPWKSVGLIVEVEREGQHFARFLSPLLGSSRGILVVFEGDGALVISWSRSGPEKKAAGFSQDRPKGPHVHFGTTAFKQWLSNNTKIPREDGRREQENVMSRCGKLESDILASPGKRGSKGVHEEEVLGREEMGQSDSLKGLTAVWPKRCRAKCGPCELAIFGVINGSRRGGGEGASGS